MPTQYRHIPTHISTQTSIIARGANRNNQPQWNQSHIETSFSTVQDEMDEKKDTNLRLPCAENH